MWGSVDRITMLVYGESGSGKTTFVGTFPGKILWLVCSGGNRPEELKSIDTPANRKRIRPVVIDSTDKFREEVERAADGRYDTVVLDHVTGFSDLVIKELLGLDRVPVSKAKAAGKGESWSLVSQQQYGQLAVIAKEAFRDMLNLPGNVVFIAQERAFNVKDDGGVDVLKPTVGAALTPSLAGWLNPACSYVGQMFKRPRMEEKVREGTNGKQVVTLVRGRGVEYCLRTEPHDVYMTKFRRPGGKDLPEVIVNPTYDKVKALIDGEE